MKLLKNNPEQEFVVYGFHKDKKEDNVLFRSFNEKFYIMILKMLNA